MSCGWTPSTVQPTLEAVPRISLTVPKRMSVELVIIKDIIKVIINNIKDTNPLTFEPYF